jgi:nucleoside 2-deoxyribosyltransferase
MNKAIFYQYPITPYKVDPIFRNSDFKVFGNPTRHNSPTLIQLKDFKYVLVKPDDFEYNFDLCFKVATYLYHYKAREIRGEVYTYFFGDINDCKEIGDEFENQICKYVSYEMLDEWYPKSLTEINDYFVNFFLVQQKYYGQSFWFKDYDVRYLLFLPYSLKEDELRASKSFLYKQLEENEYIDIHRSETKYVSLKITDKAIKQFQKTKVKENSNTAFIAIKFKENEERIKAIQNAIAECGYTPVIMTEYQTNDWIMPEIFHQIQLSKFVVVDLSLRCDGAYYEAGYAHAMGKPVIHLYDEREKENNPLHFDVAQKSTVIYNNLDDLKEKLTKRIEATVN